MVLHGAIASAYAGDLTAEEAWELLAANPAALLVDVRTQPEWAFAGVPDIRSLGRKPVLLSWKTYPAFTLNAEFASRLAEAVPDKETPLLFLCRTGGRSLDAAVAMTQQGYSACYNIADGFDGPVNDRGQRGFQAGWRAAGLPWVHGS